MKWPTGHSPRELCSSRFDSGDVGSPVFLPDLSLWYSWQRGNGSLPAEWSNSSLDEIYRDLRVPIWRLVRPWRAESTGETSTISSDEKTTTIAAGGRELISRWKRGPDGDWWQSEYPAKTVEDLRSLLAHLESRVFTLDLASVDTALAEVGDEGIVAIDLPARPFSWLMLEMLGWSDGLMLLLDAPDIVEEIMGIAEEQTQELVSGLAVSAAKLYYSPDNLDGHFVSPAYFEQFLSRSYAASAQILHDNSKSLIVHAGGPVSRILGPAAEAGIDAVAGICGPPQGDTTIGAARTTAGENLVLIGGIPQDYLLPVVEPGKLDESVEQALRASANDPYIIVGIADHVPIDADIDRVRTVADRFAELR